MGLLWIIYIAAVLATYPHSTDSGLLTSWLTGAGLGLVLLVMIARS